MATIYHNPRCSKSRQTLELLNENGIEPNVVLYLESPLNADQLHQLLDKLDIDVRQLLRTSEQEYKDLGLAATDLTEQQLIDAMVAHPRLMQRPIVVNGEKAAIGRPPEAVLALFP